MGSYHSYPKVFALGHAMIKDLFLDNIIIQEKIDGSQFSFGIFDGEIKCRSKGKEIQIEKPEKMFNNAVETVMLLKDKLKDGWTYRGEYLKTPNHNTLKYNRIPKEHIIIFDINKEQEDYLYYDAVKDECDRLGLECVPTLYVGKINNPDEVISFLENESILGGCKIEGMVFKNYFRVGNDGKVLMGKYVSEKFKEIHGKVWKEKNPDTKDVIQLIIESLKTEARYHKAIQHLKEKDQLLNEPKDIGKLIIEIQEDIKSECVDYIKQKLYNYAIDKVMRGVIAGFPEWYKEKLLENQFNT